MKKRVTVIIICLFTSFMIYAIFVTHVYHREIKVNVSVSLATQQFSSLRNISRWYLPFASADTLNFKIIRKDKLDYANQTLRLSKLTGLSAWFEVGEKAQSRTVLFSVAADTAGTSVFSLQYESSLWNKLFPGNSIIENAEKSLQSLKDYFADTKKMYGYQMEMTTVTDTAFLFTSKVVAGNTKKEAFNQSFSSLIQYAKEKEMGYTGVRIFYISPFGNDSIHLFTSIGITNIRGGGLNETFSLKKMPFKGRLLSAYYQGSFSNLNSVISAMNQFKSDNGLTTMAIPFVKLITSGVEFDDFQVIQAKAFFPVF